LQGKPDGNCPHHCMHVQEEVEAEKKNLAEYFRTGEGSKYCPTSLYFQRK